MEFNNMIWVIVILWAVFMGVGIYFNISAMRKIDKTKKILRGGFDYESEVEQYIKKNRKKIQKYLDGLKGKTGDISKLPKKEQSK